MSTPENPSGELQVFGALLDGYAKACVNLNIVAGRRGEELIADIEVNRWYPFERLRELEGLVLESYDNSDAIMERVGIHMMLGWYHFGPGKEIIKSGADFLEFQAGSQGYSSVVKGPKELVKEFKLLELDRERGRARLHSTTPLNRDMERGVLIGGMQAPGDLHYIDVVYDAGSQTFDIEFH